MAEPPRPVTQPEMWTSNGTPKGGRCQNVWRRTPQGLWEDKAFDSLEPPRVTDGKIKQNNRDFETRRKDGKRGGPPERRLAPCVLAMNTSARGRNDAGASKHSQELNLAGPANIVCRP